MKQKVTKSKVTKLCIANIGKLEKADIELKGITVIAGENDTGKSTVGKVLHSVLNGAYDLANQVYLARLQGIEEVINFNCKVNLKYSNQNIDTFGLAEHILNNENNQLTLEELTQKIFTFYKNDFENLEDFTSSNIFANDILDRIVDIINLSDDEIKKTIFNDIFNIEFNNRINNLYNNGEAYVELDTLRLKFINNMVETIENQVDLHEETIYIDSPLVLDSLLIKNNNDIGRNQQLKNKIIYKNNNHSLVNGIVQKNKLNKILGKINLVCEGELYIKNPNGNVAEYRFNNGTKTVNVKNISSGLKTFTILKTLLLNGHITNNTTLILDEPEVNLHPQWQLTFAEIIVMIQKEFDLRILLTTHSPYLLRAVELFCEKYENSDIINYYITKNNGDTSSISDVNDNIELIYEKLYKPLQILEDLRWEC